MLESGFPSDEDSQLNEEFICRIRYIGSLISKGFKGIEPCQNAPEYTPQIIVCGNSEAISGSSESGSIEGLL